MDITDQQLLQLFPRAGQVLPWLAPAMRAHGVDRAPRAAAFLAQVGHESAGLTRLVENLVYSAQGLADTWPRRFRNAAGYRAHPGGSGGLHRHAPGAEMEAGYAGPLPGSGDGGKRRLSSV